MDSRGLGEMTTGSLPVYVETAFGKKLIAVVGVDVLMKDI